MASLLQGLRARLRLPQSGRGRAAALSALGLSLAKAVSLLSVLISVPLTLSYLGPERYGIWLAISSVAAWLGIADLGMGAGLMNLVAQAAGARDAAAARRIMVSGGLVLLLVAVLAGAAFLLAFPHLAWDRWLHLHDPAAGREAIRAVAAFAACVIGGIALSPVARIQLGLQRGLVASLWQVAGSLAGLIALATAIQAQADLPGLVLAQSGVPLLVAALNGVQLLRHLELRPLRAQLSLAVMRRIAVAGAGFFVLQLCGLVAYASDSLILTQLLGPVATTEFSVPARMFSVIGIVASTLCAPLWPAYAEARAAGDRAWITRTLRRSLLLCAAGSFAAGLLLVLIGRPLVALWVGDRVHPELATLLALWAWTVLECIGVALAMFLNGMGVVRPQLIIATSFALAVLALKVFLVGRIGIVGIPLAAVLAYLLTTLLPYALLLPAILRRHSAPSVASRA